MKRNLISWLKMSLCLGLFVLACLLLCDTLSVYYSQFDHEVSFEYFWAHEEVFTKQLLVPENRTENIDSFHR